MQDHEPSAASGKTERISLRIDRFTKELIEQAAARDHRSMTGFIVFCAKTQAEQIMEKEKAIRIIGEIKKPFGDYDSLEEGYRAMAADEEREKEAMEWIEGLIGDVADEAG